MLSRRMCHLASLLAFLLVSPAAFGAAVPGTTVSLVPPDGFAPAAAFSGFEHAESGSSVLVVELPADAWAELSAIFSDVGSARAGFAAQGVTVRRVDRVQATGGEAVMLSGTQQVGEQHFDKWVALFNGERTVMVTVQAPEGAELPSEVVEAAIASVSLGTAPSLADEMGALPFTVKAEVPFRIVGTSMGAAAWMTAGSLDVDPSGTQPLLAVVASQISVPVDSASLDVVAEDALKQTRGLGFAVVTARARVRFAGTDGIRLEGTYLEQGRVCRFAQYLAIRPDGRSLRLVFMAEEAVFAGLDPVAEAIAGTVAFALP